MTPPTNAQHSVLTPDVPHHGMPSPWRALTKACFHHDMPSPWRAFTMMCLTMACLRRDLPSSCHVISTHSYFKLLWVPKERLLSHPNRLSRISPISIASYHVAVHVKCRWAVFSFTVKNVDFVVQPTWHHHLENV